MSETKKHVDAELKIRRIEAVTNLLVSVSPHLFKFLTVAVVAYFGYLSIDSLAGQITAASFIVGLFSSKNFANAVCVLAAVCSIIYGRRQSKLRKDVVERYHKYMKNEELAMDPGRTSSRMDARGENRLEDNQ